MEDFNLLTQVIGSLGFPIVACAALFYENIKTREAHKEEIGKLAESLDNNTTVMNRLVTLLESKENGN